MNYKISNGKILLTGPDRLETAERDLYILDGRISFGPAGLPEESFEVIDAARHLVMPGLINMHTHAYMTLMRNYADDVGFDEWLFKRVMPVEDTLPLEGAYWGSLLACMEMIRTGTTTFMDMHMFRGQSCRAALETGMRAWIGRGLVGEDLYGDGLSRFRQGLEEQEEYECGRIRFTLAPHAIYSCGPKLLEQVAQEAADRGMRKQIHLSESDNEVNDALRKYGKTPVALLRDTGFLDEKTILAHCVKMRGDDISIIKEAGATVVTNPASNAKLGNGFAPLQDFLDAGIQVCLGTDGTCSNNTLNLSREMNMSILLITHNFGIVAEMCHRVSVMYAGRVVEHADTKTIFRNAAHPYTRALIGSIPKAGYKEEYLPVIPGAPPQLYRQISPPPPPTEHNGFREYG